MGRAAKVKSFFESAMTDFTEQLQDTDVKMQNAFKELSKMKDDIDARFNYLDSLEILIVYGNLTHI